MSTLGDLDKLKFYRDEIKHEFSLLAMRSTMLVTCQSFLVVPFAILQTAADYRTVAVYAYLVAALGIFTAMVLIRPLDTAHRTINKWLVKQRRLFRRSPDLEALTIDRDKIPGADSDPDKDRDHRRSLSFSIYGPWAFFSFWCLASVWSTLRLILF
ncbi:MAG: hypothetical protein ACLFRY_00375 [Spirochaetia bacterium]